jgi:hypothetical protein
VERDTTFVLYGRSAAAADLRHHMFSRYTLQLLLLKEIKGGSEIPVAKKHNSSRLVRIIDYNL